MRWSKHFWLFLILLILNAPAFASDKVTLLFGGDLTLGGSYPDIAHRAKSDPGWSFANIQPLLAAADLFMVNCENPITTATSKTPKSFNFKMDPQLIDILKAGLIKIVTLANNHVMDFGSKGLIDTMSALTESGIKFVGAGTNLAEARRGEIIDIKGKKIAFLAYGNYSPAKNDQPGIAYRRPDHVADDIRHVKSAGADFVVINFHWGKERATKPDLRDVALAKMAIDNGADVIIGHHPHVIQPIERYKKGIICYSLGNFIFGGNRRGPKQGMLVKVTINPDNRIDCEKIRLCIDPVETHFQPYVIEDNII